MRILSFLLVLFPCLAVAQLPARMDGMYQGQLVYRDYSSDQSVRIGMRVRVLTEGPRQTWYITYVEPNGKEIPDTTTVEYTAGASVLRYDGKSCPVEDVSDDGRQYELRYTSLGQDNGQPSTYRHVVRATPDSLVVIKTVRQGQRQDWFERNRYSLARVRP